MARFVTFEGIEGSGKTTQLALLASFLSSRGLSVVTTREPGGTRLGERLRDVLLDPTADPTPLAELLMLEAARAQLVVTVVAPSLAAGTSVLADRFADSSLAYQGWARRLGEPVVRELNALACSGVVADRTLVFDLPVATALARARARTTTTAGNRRFEDEHEAFHRAVAEGFRRLAVEEPDRVRRIDATGTVDEVHRRVLAAVEDLWP